MLISYYNAHGDKHEISKIVDFYIKGLIDLRIFNVDVIELSGTQMIIGEIINEGNEDALFGFVTLEPLGDSNIKMIRQYIDEVEVNAACPNHRGGKGLHPVLAHDPKALEELMAETENFQLQKAIKIAPSMKESSLNSVMELCTQFRFSTIVSGNTLLGNSTIDGEQRLSVDKGGQAGTILLDIGVSQIKHLAPLCREQHIKLIACGGVLSAEAFIEYDNVGADEVQIATGFMQYGPKIFQDIYTALA